MENKFIITDQDRKKLTSILLSALQNAQGKWVEWNYKTNNEGMLGIYKNEMVSILEMHQYLITMKPLEQEEDCKKEQTNDGLPF